MKNKNRILLFLTSMFALSILLSACGGSDSTDSDSNSGTDNGDSSNGETRTLTFSYDQPEGSTLGLAVDIFANKLEELSGGSLVVEQYPAGQLGSEAEALQSVIAGDIDFTAAVSSNAATVAPQAAVFSLHYLFESNEHQKNAIADDEVFQAFHDMIDNSAEGLQALAINTLGFRSLYSEKKVESIDDLKGFKIRVPESNVDDTFWGAYGAQTVNIDFAEVYTGIQTGVMDGAENAIGPYLDNKHYEVAPYYVLTEQMANINLMFVSQETWDSLSDEEKEWVRAAGDEVRYSQPEQAMAMDEESSEELKEMGVEFVEIDKAPLMEIATPLQDEIAADLGEDAEKILELVRNVN